MKQTITYFQPSPEKKISDNIYKTSIEGLYYIKAQKHNDERGFFSQVTQTEEIAKITGQAFDVKQMNYSRSVTNVVRGMHAEGWNKLVFVINGIGMSALADIRPDSPTFKQVEYFRLGFDNQNEYGCGLYIPQGVANSICAIKGPVNYLYLVDKRYQDRDEKDSSSISIFDQELSIKWPIEKDQMILSQRDLDAITLQQTLEKK
jgi:dTDP-4-dehydrorhamnose 3,5-epimerase